MWSRGVLLTFDKCNISYCHQIGGHDKVVVIAHGFYNSKDSVLLQKLARGLFDEYDVFMFDWRGHGQSSGLFWRTSKEEQDFRAVLEYLRPRYKSIGVTAFSLGAGIIINAIAAEGGIASLISVSGPSDFNKIDYRLFELDWKNDVVYTLISKEGRTGKGVRPGPFWLKKNRPLDSIGKFKIPVLYIHGDKDWVVKSWHSQALHDATPSFKKIVILKNGPHAEYLVKEYYGEMMGLIQGWFRETLG